MIREGRNIHDLTLVYNDKVAGFSKEVAKTLHDDGWNAVNLQLYSHSGTHMDAPVHFGVGKQTIDRIHADRFISKAWVVNLSGVKPKELITVSHLGTAAQKVKKGDSLLLRTDWYRKLGTDTYRNELPRISVELAHWCAEIELNILGVEPPSVADVNDIKEVTEVHQILFAGDVIIVEGLCGLDAITKEEVTLIAMPLKIENGDGAPARIIAIEDEHV